MRLLAVIAAGVMSTVVHGSAVAEDKDKVTLNFVNANIETVVEAVSKITGKSFVIDPRVKGTVNVISGKPVQPEAAYLFLLSALRMQGFAAVGINGIVKIVPEADAKTHAAPSGRGPAKLPGGAQIMTRVFSLHNESATQLQGVIRPLVAPGNSVVANAVSNTLVVTDYADNLDRLAQIIAALDEPSGEDPQVIPLRHASVFDVVTAVTGLFGEQSGEASQRVTVTADARQNSLLVKTDNPGKLLRIRRLVEQLDQPTTTGGNIHVVYLRNADATRVAQTLRAVVSGETSPVAAATGPSFGAATPASGSAGSNMAAPITTTPVAGRSGGAGAAGQTMIQADSGSNALIITASDVVFNNLRRVIDALDKRRAQVYVEALIAEISADRASESGVQWQDLSGTHVVAGTNFGTGGRNLVGLLENIAKASTTGTLGIAPGLNIGGVATRNGRPSLGVLARFLETDAKANILSTPTLLTLDNEEAKIVIGRNVPFITGQYAQSATGTTPTPFQTYERKDVGLTLKIKPQISEGGLVRLQIYQEASSILESTLSSVSGPVTNKRSIESSVLVDDGGLIVIGGLIEDSYTAGEDKVPLAGDIPVIGGLFRYDTRKRTKTNLMVFLRPQIIRDEAGYKNITADRYDYVIGQQRQTGDKGALMNGEAAVPELPLRGSPALSPRR
jgi:general secretion pathway protein D